MKVKRYQCENCKCIRKHIDMYNEKYCYSCIDLDTGKLKEGCGEKIFENDNIKCGEWSEGDQHFCKKCFAKGDKHE